MICWNCGKEVPKGAKRCQYCESKVEDMPDMNPDEVGRMLAATGVDENMLKEMRRLAEKAIPFPDERLSSSGQNGSAGC